MKKMVENIMVFFSKWIAYFALKDIMNFVFICHT